MFVNFNRFLFIKKKHTNIAPLLITASEDVTPSSVRQARAARHGEIPLLLIRPVPRPSFASLIRGFTSSMKPAPPQIKLEAQHTDMNFLENILPKLGLDPNMFSAYPMGGGSKPPLPVKMHIIPLQQNEIKHGPNFKQEYHLTIKETPSYGKHSFFSDANPPKYHFEQAGHFFPSHEVPHISPEDDKPEEHKFGEEEHKFAEHEIHHPTEDISHFSEKDKQNLAEAEKVFGKQGPHHYGPGKVENYHFSEADKHHFAEAEKHHFGEPEKHIFSEPDHPEIHPFESHHFEPKPIDFESITPNEELVIGKPSASHPSPNTYHGSHDFKIPDGPENQFYIPKGEDTASFEVKSKTENVKFVPENHDEEPSHEEEFHHEELHHEGPSHQEHHIELPEKHEYHHPIGKPLFHQHSLFNTEPPKIEYNFPHHSETVKAFGDDYYKKFDTEEYFLPKKEPDFHKMMGESLFNPPKIPHASPLQSGYPFDDSYSFRIKGNGFGKIHITDHVYKEPQALRYHHTTPEFPNSFFPTPVIHKEAESKVPNHDFGKYAFPSNTEPTKNYISSTYKDGEVKNETNPHYEPPQPEDTKDSTTEKEIDVKFTFEPPTYNFKAYTPSPIEHQDYKDYTPSSIGHNEFKDYFKSNEHHSFYRHHPPSPIFKPFVKTSFGLV